LADSRETKPALQATALETKAGLRAHALETKAGLRANALAKRDALDDAFRIETAFAIAGHCAALGLEPGTVLSGFLPIRSEIDARPLMSALRGSGIVLCLPAVVSKTEIVFRRFDRKVALVPAGFGTFAPPAEAEIMQPEAMLVAGHYDRAIARLGAIGKRPRLIGLAFECQQADHVPDEAHDVPLDAILTENGLRSFPLKG
jgi:5-formyltetrahydrofolate cyclo-ligase